MNYSVFKTLGSFETGCKGKHFFCKTKFICTFFSVFTSSNEQQSNPPDVLAQSVHEPRL